MFFTHVCLQGVPLVSVPGTWSFLGVPSGLWYLVTSWGYPNQACSQGLGQGCSPRQDRGTHPLYVVGSVPLALTQDNFLVRIVCISKFACVN